MNRERTVVDDGLHERVARLVERDDLAILLVHELAALATELDLLARVVDVDHLDLLLVPAGCQQSGLVEKVCEVGAGETRRAAGDDGEVDVVGKRHLGGVHAENLLAPDQVGKIDVDLAVETARAE